MSKFQVGDKVKVLDDSYQGYTVGSAYNISRDIELTVTGAGRRWVSINNGPDMNPDSFELINPEEQAIKMLVDAGYTITPPKPKLSGKAYIYHYPDKKNGQVYIYNDDLWKKYVTDGAGVEGKVLLAVVDWQEGQELTKGKCSKHCDGECVAGGCANR